MENLCVMCIYDIKTAKIICHDFYDGHDNKLKEEYKIAISNANKQGDWCIIILPVEPNKYEDNQLAEMCGFYIWNVCKKHYHCY